MANDATAPSDAQRQQRADRDDAAPDFRAKYIAELEAANSFLKSQLEDSNRNAAELRASLREALKAMPRQLTAAPTDGTATSDNTAPETAQGAPLDTTEPPTATQRAPIASDATTQQPRHRKAGAASMKKPRPLWKVALLKIIHTMVDK